MKYGVDIGHNCSSDTGAVGIRREDDLTNEVGINVKYKLKELGYEVISCNPKQAQSLGDSLFKRVKNANDNNVDIFVSIHFNAGGGRGSEVYISDENSREVGERILAKLITIGYVNRGVKKANYYILRNVNSIAVQVECAFCDSVEDMKRYNADKIADAIVMGITGIDNSQNIPKLLTQKTPRKDVQDIQKILNKLKIRDISDKILKEDGILDMCTKTAIVKLKKIIGLEINDSIDGQLWEVLKLLLSRPTVNVYYKKSIVIRYIQWRLGLKVDGIYSDVTRASVMIYQKQAKLAPDGIVGIKTWNSFIG